MNINIGTKGIEEQLKRIADLIEESLSRGGSSIRSRYSDLQKKDDFSSMVLYPGDEEDLEEIDEEK